MMMPAPINENPEEGSPERVVQQVLASAMEPDEKRGWAKYESLIHPNSKRTAGAWETGERNITRARVATERSLSSTRTSLCCPRHADLRRTDEDAGVYGSRSSSLNPT